MVADLDRYLSGQSVQAPPYHFRLDEREIIAARPSRVVLAAFIHILVAAVLFLGIGSFGLMAVFVMPRGAMFVTLAVQLLAAISILLVGILIGHQILSARVWARWAGVAAFVVLCLMSLCGLLAMSIFVATQMNARQQSITQKQAAGESTKSSNESRQLPIGNFVHGMAAVYSLPMTVGLVLGVVGIVSLVTRPTREWFAFARQIRLEHDSMREQIE